MKTLLLGNIFLLMVLASCSPAPEKTKAKISFGASYAGDNFPGGLYILGHNISEDRVTMLRIENQNHELTLDNGKWEFASMGWEGSKPLGGNIKCFLSSKYELDGKDIDIEFNLTNAGCSHEFFTPNDFSSGTPKKPNQISVTSCAFMERKKSDDYTDDYHCEDSPGLEKSYKVLLYNVPLTHKDERDDRKFAPFESGCVNFDSINYGTIGPSIPAFSDFPMTFQTFSSPDCSGEKTVHHFPKGIRVDNDSNSAQTDGVGNAFNPLAFANPGDGTRTKVFLNDKICSSPGFSTRTLPQQNTENGLDGTTRPYYICNEAQFGYINGDPSKKFLVADDIDFNNNGDNSILSNFTGDFDGQNFTLKNYQYTASPAAAFGLFKSIMSGASLRNINIQNFDLNLTGSSFYGILVGQVSSSTDAVNISNIYIDNQSSITSNTGRVGGVIGHVAASSASGDISLSDLYSSADVTITGASTHSAGGLFGTVNNVNALTSKITIFDSGISEANITISPLAIGHPGVGGISGQSLNAKYIRVNTYLNSITAPRHIGGIIGLSQADLISQSSTQSVITINSDGEEYFGGVIGKATLASSNTFSAVVDSIITSSFFAKNSGEAANKLGGIIGGTYFPAGETGIGFLLKNNKVDVETILNGNDHGGLLGLEYGVENGVGNGDYFINNIVYADLIEETSQNSTLNSFKGGLFGTLQGGQAKRNIVVTKLRSVGPIGGLAGAVKYNGGGGPQSNIQENYIHSRIKTYHDGTDIIAGGAVGRFESAGPAMVNTKVDGHMLILDSGSNCDGSGSVNDRCGRLVGDNLSTAAITGAVVNNRLFVDTNSSGFIDGPDTELPVGTLKTGSSLGLFIFEDDQLATVANHAAIGSGPWDGSWNTTGIATNKVGLSFYNKHLFNASIPNSFDLDSEVTGDFSSEFPDFLAGNKLEPILIYNKEDWNSVGSDAYLLSKSFMLMDNIYFNSDASNFIPFGGKGTMGAEQNFTGHLYSNGYTLSDINILASDFPAGEPIGIIRKLGASENTTGEVGEYQYPLYIDNLYININQNQSSDIGGLVGSFENGTIFARITNAKIETTGAGQTFNVGGLVGSITDNSKTEIFNSLVQGNIEDNGLGIDTIGGIVGKINAVSGDSVKIQNTAVHTSKISASGATNIGGFIGYLANPSGASAFIHSSYVYFSEASSTIQGATQMGGFIAFMQDSGTHEIHNNFVDLSKLGSAPSGDTTEMFSKFASSSGGNSVKNYVIKGVFPSAGNPSMVANSYSNYMAMYLDGTNNNLGLFSSLANNAFYYDIGNPKNSNDDRVKLYWEYEPK